MDHAGFVRGQTRIQSPPLTPELRLHLAGEFTPLWQMTEDALRATNLPPPFWAIAWPGGQALARYILDRPCAVAERRVIDFAAGSGIAGIAAMRAGATRVTAIDIDALARVALTLNAALNDVTLDAAAEQDLSCVPAVDMILAGDICYERTMATALMLWLRSCADQGIEVLIADPGRAYLPTEGLTKLFGYEVPTSRDIEDQDSRFTTIWRLE